MSNPEVTIIGGGLSGLCCARRLHEAGVSFQLLEASEEVGGRVRTDEVNGFLLDRGFQVLLTAYPEAQDVLDYDALNLARFAPGMLVRYRGRFHRFTDPWRSPRHLFATASSPIGSLTDKLRVARLRSRVCRSSLDKLFERPETTTINALQQEGFSKRFIESFFRPFLGGVFLERDLNTSSRMFDFVFRMFATGNVVLPAGGIGEIARQITNKLPDETLRTRARVEAFEGTTVRLTSGEMLQAGAVVIACEAPAAAKLLVKSTPPSGRSVTCLYFAAERPPIEEPILVLNGDGVGPINNLCVPSQVTPTYAPDGQALVSVTVLGLPDGDVEASVRKQLLDWFGPDVIAWRHLRTYRIPYALPSQSPPALSPVEKSSTRGDHLFVCGDYLDTASIQGAMVSGRRAAECVMQD
jgi:phytoene dehydrogenase-like protein